MFRNKSVNLHDFSMIPRSDIPRSSFRMQKTYKSTFDAGYLIPFHVDEVLPGDTFSVGATAFARMATPLYPLMDNLHLDTFWFFVPNRLVWNNWQKFQGEQENPGDSINYTIPQQVSPTNGYAVNSLQDYMGLPVTGTPAVTAGISHSALPLRCYNLIYNQWFRDENLQNSVVVDKGDGPDNVANYVLLRRGKRKDYFTGALPWPQKGAQSVQLPLGTSAPVKTSPSALVTGAQTEMRFLTTAGAGLVTGRVLGTTATGGMGETGTVGGSGTGLYPSNLYADLSTATAATINQIRQAFQTQKLLERDARGGTRYTEIIRAHFGVISPDARLQRPEYLGGGSTQIATTPIPQTSATDAGTPQGNLAAMGTFGHSGVGFVKSFTEHCIVLGLISVRASMTYQQGIDRMWTRRSRFDFYWPALSHLGEQAVLNREIFVDTSKATNDEVFGYQERFAEYRYKPSKITGKFRSTAADSLDIWHLAQEFDDTPILNTAFLRENPPIDRVIATPDEPQFLFDAFFRYKCVRPMPTYSVPGLIDHF